VAKQNCNDTMVCSDLLNVHDLLAQGGYNIVFRHGKTTWQELPMEVAEPGGCHFEGNCVEYDGAANQFVDSPSGRSRQRKLQMLGYDELFLNAAELATLAEGGVPFNSVVRTSPMARCLDHGAIYASALGGTAVGEWGLHYIEGYVQLNDMSDEGDPNPFPTVLTKSDAVARQVKQLRRIAGTPPAAGMNDVFVTHGFNIRNAFGTAVDEGYALILKAGPENGAVEDSICERDLEDGSTDVFEYPDGTYNVDLVARMPPDGWSKMNKCVALRTALQEDIHAASDGHFFEADSNHNLAITRAEFTNYCVPGGGVAVVE
jgi:hypothetical protein